jgi:hypothetical protein
MDLGAQDDPAMRLKGFPSFQGDLSQPGRPQSRNHDFGFHSSIPFVFVFMQSGARAPG